MAAIASFTIQGILGWLFFVLAMLAACQYDKLQFPSDIVNLFPGLLFWLFLSIIVPFLVGKIAYFLVRQKLEGPYSRSLVTGIWWGWLVAALMAVLMGSAIAVSCFLPSPK